MSTVSCEAPSPNTPSLPNTPSWHDESEFDDQKMPVDKTGLKKPEEETQVMPEETQVMPEEMPQQEPVEGDTKPMPEDKAVPEDKDKPMPEDKLMPEDKPTRKKNKRKAPVDLDALTPKSRKIEEQKIKNRINSTLWHAKWISKGVPRSGFKGGHECGDGNEVADELPEQERGVGEVAADAPQEAAPSSSSAASEPSIDPDMMHEARVLVSIYFLYFFGSYLGRS